MSTVPEATQQHRFVPIGDGCYRDTSTLYRNAQGEWSFFEFTPILNVGNEVRRDAGKQLVAECTLAGGGWSLTTVKQEVALRNYARYAPASDVPDSPAGWVLTADDDVSPPSGSVWAVCLYLGLVGCVYDSTLGFVRGGRLVPASQL